MARVMEATGSTVLGRTKAQLLIEPVDFSRLNEQECLYVMGTVNPNMVGVVKAGECSIDEVRDVALETYYVSKDRFRVIHGVTTYADLCERINNAI